MQLILGHLLSAVFRSFVSLSFVVCIPTTRWRNGLVASMLHQRPRGRGFESAGCGLSCSNSGLLFAPLAWDYSALHPLGSVNEYWPQLGRYKAGTCDAAWCAPCTGVPLRWPCLLVGAITSTRYFDLSLADVVLE